MIPTWERGKSCGEASTGCPDGVLSSSKAADRRYYQVDNGPISQRLATLDLMGDAFGRFSEASESLHNLVSVMANARVKQQELAWGLGH